MQYAFGELVADIALPFSLGILIAGAITFFFPQDIMPWINSHKFFSMLLMLGAGIPMYVCATSSTPIAAALILKGLNPGAALVFLLAGPATNAAAIYVVKNLFSRKTLAIYLTMVATCSLVMGVAVDQVYTLTGIDPHAAMGSATHVVPGFIQWSSAFILIGLLGFQWAKHGGLIRKQAGSHL